jgi:hypothetical protein
VGTNYVVLGRRDPYGNIDLTASSSASSAQFYSLSPAISLDTGLRSVSMLGDVNGDGFDDLLIGDPLNSRAYVLYGSSRGLRGMTAGFTITAESTGDYLGFSVSSAGDFNGDGTSDLVLCGLIAGKCYVLYGRRNGFTNVDLSAFSSQWGVLVYSSNKMPTGIAVAGVGDFNGDGFDDIALSCSPNAALSTIYVVFGDRGISRAIDLESFQSGVAGVRLLSPSWSFAGVSLSGLGDINGDGLADLIVGSIPYRGGYTVQQSYVVYGSDHIDQDVDLGSFAGGSSLGFVVSGGGIVVSGVGDVNGDGLGDLMVTSFSDWQRRSGAYLLVYPSQLSSFPSLFPTSSPSQLSATPTTARPSAVPTLAPSASPSALPTIAPSRPTAVPSFAPSGPSLAPTLAPTAPTIAPSRSPTASPTPRPSRSPSQSPTVRPSRSSAPVTPSPSQTPTRPPTVAPTRRPTLRPSVIPTLRPTANRAPTSQPSSQPSMDGQLGFLVRTLPVGGVYVGTARKEIFIVEGRNDTVITGRGLFNKYVVLPRPDVRLTVTDFKERVDVLDLSAFPTIQAVGDLSFRTNPLLLLLPGNQTILLANLAAMELTADNFVFAAPTSTDSRDGAYSIASFWTTSLVVPLGVLVGCVLLTLCGSWYYAAVRDALKDFPYAGRLDAEDAAEEGPEAAQPAPTRSIEVVPLPEEEEAVYDIETAAGPEGVEPSLWVKPDSGDTDRPQQAGSSQSSRSSASSLGASSFSRPSRPGGSESSSAASRSNSSRSQDDDDDAEVEEEGASRGTSSGYGSESLGSDFLSELDDLEELSV